MFDILEEIWSTTKRNKLRTALTGFAVAWGIFMLIFLLGAGNGLINGLTSQSVDVMDNSMSLRGGYTSKPYDGLKEGRRILLDDNDMNTTAHQFASNVDELGATQSQDAVVVSKGENYMSTELLGVYPNEIRINKKKIMAGRFINDIDLREKRKTVVLSEDQAKELMPGNPTGLVGKYIKIDQMGFLVVGVYEADRSGMNTGAYTAFTTLRMIYNQGNKVGRVVFSFKGLSTLQESEEFEKAYRSSINTNHRADPEDENAVWIWNRLTQAMQMNTGMGIIRTALWIIGLFTLLSGIVGVSNIMLITVKERTREFGIRKAIGASPASILRLIIVESVIITTFFGYIGMLLGVAANEYMNATVANKAVDLGVGTSFSIFVNPTVGLDVCIHATLVMIIAGTLAGLIPARKAAKIRPIEALRAE